MTEELSPLEFFNLYRHWLTEDQITLLCDKERLASPYGARETFDYLGRESLELAFVYGLYNVYKLSLIPDIKIKMSILPQSELIYMFYGSASHFDIFRKKLLMPNRAFNYCMVTRHSIIFHNGLTVSNALSENDLLGKNIIGCVFNREYGFDTEEAINARIQSRFLSDNELKKHQQLIIY